MIEPLTKQELAMMAKGFAPVPLGEVLIRTEAEIRTLRDALWQAEATTEQAVTASKETLAENAKLRERLNNLKQLLCEGKWTLDGLVHADVVCMYINATLNGDDDE